MIRAQHGFFNELGIHVDPSGWHNGATRMLASLTNNLQYPTGVAARVVKVRDEEGRPGNGWCCAFTT